MWPPPNALTADDKLMRDAGGLEALASQEAPLFPEANWMKASAATAEDKARYSIRSTMALL